MKIPPGLLDPRGQIAKGVVNLELNGNDVEEYGLTTTGKHSTCYVLASPGDIVTANIAINSGIMDEFADLVVDGVLRNSWPNTRGAKVFSYIFERGVYTGIHMGEAKKANKFARMKVQERNFSEDFSKNGNQEASSVSSIKIQIYRKETTEKPDSAEANAEASASGTTQHGSGSGSGNGDAASGETAAENTTIVPTAPDIGVCQREPNYIKYATWQDLNRHIDSDVVTPPFEIGFFNGNKHFAKPKERVIKVYKGDYKLWASFEFLLRSTADLRTLGFEDVPLHYSPNPPSTNAFPSIFDESREESIEVSTGAAPTEHSLDALLAAEGEEEEQPAEPVVKPKKAAPRKRSKKLASGEEPEQLPTSTTKTAKKGKAAAAKIPTGEKKPKPKSKPRSKPETKELETREEYVARKKAELILPGVKSAPAHQAYLLRGATEEPEEDEDDIETAPGTPTQNGMSEILARGVMQSVPSTSVSRLQRLPTHFRRQSSPALLGLIAAISTPGQEMQTYMHVLSALPSDVQGLPAHIRRERRPSLPSMPSPVPLSHPNRDMTTYNVPCLTDSPEGPVAPVLLYDVQRERRLSLLSMNSQSRPSTPPNGQVEIYNIPGHPGSPESNTQLSIMNGPGVRRPSLQLTTSESTPSTPLNCTLSTYTMPGLTPTSHHSVQGYLAATSPERLSTQEPTKSEIELLNQREPEDTHMQGTSRPSSPAPSDAQSESQTQTQPKPSQSLPTTLPSFLAPSETPTETPTEVAIPSELKTSCLSSQRDNSIFYVNDLPTSQAASTPDNQFATSHQSFNYTEESPILGNSQCLISGQETNPLMPAAEQARLHWTPLNEALGRGKDGMCEVRAQSRDGDHVESPMPGFVVSLKGNPVQRPQAEMITPPPSAQKRKADSITGTNPNAYIQPRKVPSQEQLHAERELELQHERDIETPLDKKKHEMVELQAHQENQQQRVEMDQRVIQAVEKRGKETEPPWEEEIMRQNEVARPRMAAAELHRKALQAKYENALAVQKEREKVNELNKEAERLEHENAELQATIAALYRGEAF